MKNTILFIVFLLIFTGAIIVLFLTNSESIRNSQTAGPVTPTLSLKQKLKRSLTAIGQIPSLNLKQETLREKGNKTAIRENRNGRDYIPISVYELYNLCATGKIKSFQKNAFVLRGIVLKNEMPGKDQTSLFRATQWCCKGHEVAWGFRLQGDVSDTIDSGEWVNVYGRIQGVTEVELEAKVTTQFAPSSILRNDYQLIVDHMEATSVPKEIYTTYWSGKEPFYY